MDRKKVVNWIGSILIVMLLVWTLDGGWLWLGIGGVVLASLVLAGIKMWRGREHLKMLMTMAGNLGTKHKEMAKKKEEDSDEGSDILQSQHRQAGGGEPTATTEKLLSKE